MNLLAVQRFIFVRMCGTFEESSIFYGVCANVALRLQVRNMI